MLKGAIARRYAGALFELARKQKTIDRTLDDIKGIAQLFSQRKIAYLLREPKVPALRKEKALREALTSHVQPISLNLALLVVQRQLVEAMPSIAKEYEQLVRNYRNQIVAQVTTSAPLDTTQSNLVKQSLEKRTGKQVIMESRLDPSILGGLVVRIGDEVIDGSVRYRLNALQKQLLAGITASNTDISSEGLEEFAHSS